MAQAQLPGYPLTGTIPLGQLRSAIDYSKWQKRSKIALEKDIKFSLTIDENGDPVVETEKLTPLELWKLGFKAAATGYNIYDKIKHKQ